MRTKTFLLGVSALAAVAAKDVVIDAKDESVVANARVQGPKKGAAHRALALDEEVEVIGYMDAVEERNLVESEEADRGEVEVEYMDEPEEADKGKKEDEAKKKKAAEEAKKKKAAEEAAKKKAAEDAKKAKAAPPATNATATPATNATALPAVAPVNATATPAVAPVATPANATIATPANATATATPGADAPATATTKPEEEDTTGDDEKPKKKKKAATASDDDEEPNGLEDVEVIDAEAESRQDEQEALEKKKKKKGKKSAVKPKWTETGDESSEADADEEKPKKLKKKAADADADAEAEPAADADGDAGATDATDSGKELLEDKKPLKKVVSKVLPKVVPAPAVEVEQEEEVALPTTVKKAAPAVGVPGKVPGTVHLKDAPAVGGYAADGSTTIGKATKGRTDGEPGSAAAHCCGMKGLGGATVDVLCHPQQIALGKPFTVNVKYATDVKRPVDIKVDVLNAESKKHYAGETVPMEDLNGEVSLTITMSDQAQEPFLWKVFVAPRGEPFPNMLAETGFNANLGPEVVGDCVPFKNRGETPAEIPRVNYVMLNTVPETLTPGNTATIKVDYDLVTGEDATIGVSLMKAGPNQYVSGKTVNAEAGLNTVTLDLPIPADIDINERVYVVATMTPVGKAWEDRLGEDRSYRVKLAGARRLRAAINANGRLSSGYY